MKELTLADAVKLKKQLAHWLEEDLTAENLRELAQQDPIDEMYLGRTVLVNGQVEDGDELYLSYQFVLKVKKTGVSPWVDTESGRQGASAVPMKLKREVEGRFDG